MKTKNFLGLFVVAVALVFALPFASAFANVAYVEADGTVLHNGASYAVEPLDVINLNVIFNAISNQQDVRVVARVIGEPGIFDATEEFDVFSGRTYSKRLEIQIPRKIDTNEEFVLEITIEGRNIHTFPHVVHLRAQRLSYDLDFLFVEANNKIEAGQTLVVDFGLKNRGGREAEDNIVVARIPELGISKIVFVGDLTPFDQDNPEKFDSEDAKIFLNIPSNAKAGLYTLEVEAFNDDTEVTIVRKVEILGSASRSSVIPTATSKSFAVGEDASYGFSVINAGDSIKVYNFVVQADSGLTIELDESTVVVPAGNSKSVDLTARASREGTYDFKILTYSIDGNLVQEQRFSANVEGKTIGGNTVVVLTIVLAVIFVVLLIVLIVLLTRKPEKSGEFNESYY